MEGWIKQLIRLALLSCSSFLVHATTIDLGSDASSPTRNISAAVGVLLDRSDMLSIRDVSAPSFAEHFHAQDLKQIHLGFQHHIAWLKVSLRNPGNVDLSPVITLDKASLGHIDFYQPTTAGQFLVTKAGCQTPGVIGDLPGTGYLFVAHVAAHTTTTFYFSIRSDLALSFPVLLSDVYQAGISLSWKNMIYGSGLGLLIGILIYHIFVFIRTRQPPNLHYAWYTLAISLYLAANAGYLGVYFFAQAHLQNTLEIAGLLLSLLTASRFTQSFLKLHRLSPLTYQILWLQIALLALLLIAIPWIPLLAIARISSIVAMFGSLLILGITLHAMWLGESQARVFLWSGSFSLLSVLLSVLLSFGRIDLPIPAGWMVLIATLVQGLIIILTMGMSVGKLRIELMQMRQRALSAEGEIRSRSRFMMQLSHEMRTPMSGILGMSELLLDTPLTPNQHEFASTIQASTHSLLRILNDLLDYANSQSNPLSIVSEPFELDALLEDCLDIFRSRAEEKHLELIGSRSKDLPNKALGDPTRLRQVISSLLRNALRYTHHGEIVLSLMAGSAPDTLRGEVRDTGIGIPAEQMAHLFTSGNNSTEQSETHFGLSICQQLITLMGGKIGAESEERHGSIFWFEVPLRAQTQEQPARLPFEDKLQGLRLLVVDDNHTSTRVIEQQALSWGMKVTTCDNGAEALAIARNASTLGEPFDIIVLDHNMPGMSGLQLAARIKEDLLITNDVLVLMLTGVRMAPTTTMAINVGIRRVLTKPVTERDLKTAIAEELGHLDRQRPREREPKIADVQQHLRQLRVLIAEDNHLSQKVIRGMLQKLGVECSVVANGKEAVEEVSRRSYDIVLMDCDMPFVDGYVATQAIREWERQTRRRPIPILALTAHILDEHQARSLEVGMNEHLSKPVELSQLREALLRWSIY